MKRLLALLCLGCAACALAQTDSLPTFTFEQYLLVPVRVHLLRAKDAPNADCKLTPKDVERIFGKVQRIWQSAGIQLYLESVLEEESENQKEYHTLGDDAPLPAQRQLRPLATRLASAFHVYYIHRLSVNGVYLDRASIFVKDTASLRRVPGGSDEPIPRVTAHELGHGLGLPHRQEIANLMASGTTGTALNAEEIEIARKTARLMDWVQTGEQGARQANELFDTNRRKEARAIYERLAAVPGESPVKEKAIKRLKELANAQPLANPGRDTLNSP